MILSVVIVNYNVRHFLEQCLTSVFASDCRTSPTLAAPDFELDVWVVDNNSVDGSVQMVAERFPQVHLIANADNPGFAKANNQALRQCKGDYMLLLNPDTLVERDTFAQCLAFYGTHPDCGGLGVKMINGDGQYLKESKRGFPTPETSFYKISGLIRLFPHHPVIARYYMGHLSEDETHPIEILPGAYLMISRPALQKVGLLDESYFMYGEDIDFSWRIRLAGYENYYLPSARIIHYKGESTKKGSLNYVYTFYNAMVIFAKRYFSGPNAKLYIALIQCAIWLRATLSWAGRILQRVALPATDFLLSWGGFVAIKQLWATCWADNVNYYPTAYTWFVLPLYVVVMLLLSWLSGGYDKPVRLGRMAKGILIGSAVLLLFYSLLDETQRYSRAVLLLGSLWTLLSTLGLRTLLGLMGVEGYRLQRRRRAACVVVGADDEYRRITQLYAELGIHHGEMLHADSAAQLPDMVRIYRAGEVIFCSRDMQAQTIISAMQQLSGAGVEFKIAPAEGDVVIGSNAISSREDLCTIEYNTLALPANRRNKRLFDLLASMLLLIFSPVLIWFQQHKGRYLRDTLRVLTGRRSWVGNAPDGAMAGVPQGVFTPSHILPGHVLDSDRLNLRYTKNYKVTTDLSILLRNWRNL